MRRQFAELETVTRHAQDGDFVSVDIAGRFRFKAVMVRQSTQIDYIKLYTYLETPRQPLLIHQATFRPPFTVPSAPHGLTGEQRVYGGPKERELIYRCTLQEVAS